MTRFLSHDPKLGEAPPFRSERSPPSLLFSWFPEHFFTPDSLVGVPGPWLVLPRGSLGTETKSRLAPTKGATPPPPQPLQTEEDGTGAGTEALPRPRSQSEHFLQLRLPHHPTFFPYTPYFLSFFIVVKCTEQKLTI